MIKVNASNIADNSLEVIEAEIRHRLNSGEPWGPQLIEIILSNSTIDLDIAARARRLAWTDRSRSLSAEEWKRVLLSYVWEQLQNFRIADVTKDFEHCLRRLISFCVINALRDHCRGSRPRSGRVNVVASGDVALAARDDHCSDGEPTNAVSVESSHDATLAVQDRTDLQASFIVRELEDCISEQINKNFNRDVQFILKLLVFDRMGTADVASAIGKSAGRVSQIKTQHLVSLGRLVRERCLGERS